MNNPQQDPEQAATELVLLRRRVAELEAAVEQYQQQEAQLAHLATFPIQNPNLVIEIDGNGRVTYLNPAAELRFPELLTQALDHPLLQGLQPLVADLQAGEQQYVAREIDLGNTVYEQKINLTIENNTPSIRVFVHDISERKQAEQQALKAERLAALGLLAATLAHEINNPLQILQNHLDLLLDFPLEAEESRRYLQIMRYQFERLNAITRHALNFARSNPLPRQEVLVTRLAERTLELAGAQLQQNGIELITSFQPVPPVTAVPDQIEQVLLNLIINAAEAAPVGSQIHVALFAELDQVVMTVTNDGPPIPTETLPHIFEALFTTKSEGTGLGLWLSYNLIQQHNGSLTVENLADGRGVTFTVKLPVAQPAEVE